MRKVKLVKFIKYFIIVLEWTQVSINNYTLLLNMGQDVVILLIFKNIMKLFLKRLLYNSINLFISHIAFC